MQDDMEIHYKKVKDYKVSHKIIISKQPKTRIFSPLSSQQSVENKTLTNKIKP